MISLTKRNYPIYLVSNIFSFFDCYLWLHSLDWLYRVIHGFLRYWPCQGNDKRSSTIFAVSNVIGCSSGRQSISSKKVKEERGDLS